MRALHLILVAAPLCAEARIYTLTPSPAAPK